MNEFINFAAWLMPSILLASLAASLLALMVIGLSRWFRSAMSPRWLYALWILVAMRMVLFVCPPSQWSVLNWMPQGETAVQTMNSGTADLAIASFSPHKPVETVTPNLGVSLMIDTPPESIATLPAWFEIASVLWLVVVSLLLARLLIQAISATRLLRQSHEITQPSWLDLFQSCKKQLGIHRNIKVVRTEQLPMPVIMGIFRPTIIIPGWCLREMDPKQIRLIMQHELVHFKNYDIPIHLAASIVRVLHWFNPFAAVMHRRICQLREICCDRRVLQLSSQSNTGHLYGETVIQVAERCSQSRTAHAWMRGLIGTAAMPSNQNSLFERIQMMKITENSKRFSSISGIAIAFVLVMVTFTSAQHSQPLVTSDEQKNESSAEVVSPPQLPMYANPVLPSEQPPVPVGNLERTQDMMAYHLSVLEGDATTMDAFLKKFSKPGEMTDRKSFTAKPPAGFSVAMQDFDQKEAAKFIKEKGIQSVLVPIVAVGSLERPAQVVVGGEVPFATVKTNEQGRRVQSVEFKPLGFQLELTSRKQDDAGLVHMLSVTDSHLDGSFKTRLETDNGTIEVDLPNISTTQCQTVFVGSHESPSAFCYSTRTATDLRVDHANMVKRIILIRTHQLKDINRLAQPPAVPDPPVAPQPSEDETFSFHIGVLR